MTSFEEIHPLSSDAEESKNSPQRSFPVRKVTVALALCLGLTAFVAMRGTKECKPLDFEALQGKSDADVDARMGLKATALKSIKNRTLADRIVMKSMKHAGQTYARHYSDHQERKLPADPADAARRQMLTSGEVAAYRADKKANRNTESTTAYCAFNVLEAFVSVVGMGDDINAIIRVCPSPRDGESELACQVDGGILVTWVANAAAKLSFAASNCAVTLNVDAICSVGVTGLVSIMGELAAAASLAAATCTPTPPSLTTTKISVLGDQTVRPQERRLLIGEGTVGNGVQCAVDVGMVAANIANMGISIYRAVNLGFCGRKNIQSAVNKLTGIPEALCTVDIGGAIAYISQVVTFINLIVVHCQDFLDVSALCGGSISGIITAAAAIAPYGAAVHAACAENHILKNPEIQAKINSLYTVPTIPTSRRLQEVEEAVGSLTQIRKDLEKHLGMNVTHKAALSKAELAQMIQLIDGGVDEAEGKPAMSGSGAFEEECA